MTTLGKMDLIYTKNDLPRLQSMLQKTTTAKRANLFISIISSIIRFIFNYGISLHYFTLYRTNGLVV